MNTTLTKDEIGHPVFKSVEDLAASGYIFRITDNGGETADRTTVMLSDGTALALFGMEGRPGSMWIDRLDPAFLQDRVTEGREVDLALGDLPERLRAHVLARINKGFEAMAPRFAQEREAAAEFCGLHTDIGVGIYRQDGAFHVRDEEGPDRDAGPFATWAEALGATLPTAHSLAGEEYHPPASPSDLQASPENAEALQALEARVERGEDPDGP